MNSREDLINYQVSECSQHLTSLINKHAMIINTEMENVSSVSLATFTQRVRQSMLMGKCLLVTAWFSVDYQQICSQ